MRFTRILSCGLMLGVATAAAPAMALTNWDNPSGNQTDFTWSDGNSTNDLYGSGVNSGHDFTFEPSGFVVNDQFFQTSGFTIQAVLPQRSVYDGFSVDIVVKTGYRLYGVSVSQSGAFTSTGGTVDATGMLSVYDIPTLDVARDGMQTIPVFPASESNGTWTGSAQVPLTGEWSSVNIVMITQLTATGTGLIPDSIDLQEVPVFSFNQISLDHAKLSLDIRPTGPTVIPLPSALMLFPLGAAAAWACRKRLVKA